MPFEKSEAGGLSTFQREGCGRSCGLRSDVETDVDGCRNLESYLDTVGLRNNTNHYDRQLDCSASGKRPEKTAKVGRQAG